MRGTLLATFFALHAITCLAQFPAVCNTNATIETKTCCPNDCGGPNKGECTNVTGMAADMWSLARPGISELMLNSTFLPGKGKADVRYQWPTAVFEKVCMCSGNYYGEDCTECKFGYTGANCATKAAIRTRKQFSSLTADEKAQLVRGYSELKHEYGRFAVAVGEPASYASGLVTLSNVTTFDMFVYVHYVSARDEVCPAVHTINFAHEGPAFPVWHRHYMLVLEREFQRILNNDSFSFPYWSWESFEMDMFTVEYLGTPATDYSKTVNVSANYFNSTNWPLVCDAIIENGTCGEVWPLCNPNEDRKTERPLQRGKSGNVFLPSLQDIWIALAAPSYESSGDGGIHGIYSPRASFRNRLEGFSQMCSVTGCVGNFASQSFMHNAVHLWIGGHLSLVPSAVNDPIFFLHHCNVDRVFESWIRRFTKDNSSHLLLPGYTPSRGGHPGHNKHDWLVPFFPLVTVQDYYRHSTDLGYTYEHIFEADLDDASIADCITNATCASCSSNDTCINCSPDQADQCPFPETTPTSLPTVVVPNQSLILILALGIPLLISLVTLFLTFVALVVYCLSSARKSTV